MPLVAVPLTEITHIVPALPPAVNGVGDYAMVLARALQERGASLFVLGLRRKERLSRWLHAQRRKLKVTSAS